MCAEGGIGDNYAFAQILPELMEKNPEKTFMIATYFPDVFSDWESNEKVKLITVNDAKIRYPNLRPFNVYARMEETKKTLIEAFRDIYDDNNNN